MLQTTEGIVLRSVKYGETSLVATVFTKMYGVQSYIVKGVRKPVRNRAAFFQPGTPLDLVVYQQPAKNLQYIREFQCAYIYTSIHEDVVKNSILMFSAELLLRLLPEHSPQPAIFDFCREYFISLDKTEHRAVANFPLFFMMQCSRLMGYEIRGTYSPRAQYVDLSEGEFSGEPPRAAPFLNSDEVRALSALLQAPGVQELSRISMNSNMRMNLLEWFVVFLQTHTQHMGHMKSVSVLRAILH